jgi:hypothetical protein
VELNALCCRSKLPSRDIFTRSKPVGGRRCTSAVGLHAPSAQRSAAQRGATRRDALGL